jgi:hypothetical protein
MANPTSAAPGGVILRDDGCCFWIKCPKLGTKIKVGVVGIVAAIAAIAVVGSILLVLAQQGFHLGGINSIAGMVEAKWLYVGMGIATAALIASVIVIVVLIRKFYAKPKDPVRSDPDKSAHPPPSGTVPVEHTEEAAKSQDPPAAAPHPTCIAPNQQADVYRQPKEEQTDTSATPAFQQETLDDKFREQIQLWNISGVCNAIAPGGLFFYASKNSRFTFQLITYTRGVAESRSIMAGYLAAPLVALVNQDYKLLTSHKIEAWKNAPLVVGEIEFIKEGPFKAAIEYWIKKNNLNEREFVQVEQGFYFCILVRHPNKDGKPEFAEHYFKTEAPDRVQKIKDLIATELQGYAPQ